MRKEYILDKVRKSTGKENQIAVLIYCSQHFLEHTEFKAKVIKKNNVSDLHTTCLVGGISAFTRIEMTDMDIDTSVTVLIDMPENMADIKQVKLYAVTQIASDADVPSSEEETEMIITGAEIKGRGLDESEKNVIQETVVWSQDRNGVKKILNRLNTNINTATFKDGRLYIKGWCVHYNPVKYSLGIGGFTANGKQSANKAEDIASDKKTKNIIGAERFDVIAQFPEYQGAAQVGFEVTCDYTGGNVVLRIRDDKEGYATCQRIHWLQSDAAATMGVRIKKGLLKLQRYNSNMGMSATIKSVREKIRNKLKSDSVGYDKWATERLVQRISRTAKYEQLPVKELKNIKLNEGYRLIKAPEVILTGDAMACYNRYIDKGEYDILYSDHDQYIKLGEKIKYLNPSFKPDFNIDLLRGYNYIGDTIVVSEKFLTRIADEMVGMEEKTGGHLLKDANWVHSLLLMAYEKGAKIAHINQVLYHKSNECERAKPVYDKKKGRLALTEHLKRMNLDADVEIIKETDAMSKALSTGYYSVNYKVKGTPKVSVVIPNKDHKEDLKKCIDSIINVNTYKNYEIIVVENNSVESEIFDYYRKLEGKYQNVRVLTWDKEFNYSAINNYAVGQADGEFILLLNNDIEIISPEAIASMVGMCQRQDVAAVGARLYYEDGSIQHMGVVTGFGGVAAHLFTGICEDEIHEARSLVNCDYSAVTAACMMVSREDYLYVGGFDEGYQVAFNDVDFCLKLRETNRLVVYNSNARLYHYESKSRGVEDTVAKQDRFMSEIERFTGKWADILQYTDPYYNNNLTLKTTSYQVRG